MHKVKPATILYSTKVPEGTYIEVLSRGYVESPDKINLKLAQSVTLAQKQGIEALVKEALRVKAIKKENTNRLIQFLTEKETSPVRIGDSSGLVSEPFIYGFGAGVFKHFFVIIDKDQNITLPSGEWHDQFLEAHPVNLAAGPYELGDLITSPLLKNNKTK